MTFQLPLPSRSLLWGRKICKICSMPVIVLNMWLVWLKLKYWLLIYASFRIWNAFFFLWVVHGILFLFSFLIPILLKCDYFDVCWFLIFFFIYTCKSLECFGCVDCAIIFINLWHFSWVFEGAITYSYYQCHVKCPWFLCACVWESEMHRSQK